MFEGQIFTLDLGSDADYKQQQNLRKDITSNGGVISYIVTKKVSVEWLLLLLVTKWT